MRFTNNYIHVYTKDLQHYYKNCKKNCQSHIEIRVYKVNENLFKIIINVGDCVSAGKTDVECLVKSLQLPGTGA